MLAVCIHGDRVSKTFCGSMFESGTQGRAFAGIVFEANNFAFRQIGQWHS
jgi:hypothetical protein